MENKKYEQLIDLIINEQEDKARELFHELVVQKSREIYESIMDEEMMDEEMTGQIGDLMDEISAEESGHMVEDDLDGGDDFGDDADDVEGDDSDIGIEDIDGEDYEDQDDFGDEEDEGEESADLADVKDKFEDLLADFERILQGHEEEEAGEEEEEAGEEGEEAGEEEEEEGEEGEEEDVMEAVQLQKVPGLYDSKIGGDDGSNTKSPSLNQPRVKAAGVNPVKFSGSSETVPTSPKKPSNEYSKKEGTLIGDVGNSPGNKKGPTLKAAPKPVTSQASGVNTKSPTSKG
jgi:hypothetical protein